MRYQDMFMRLTYETAGVIFIKRDGTIRTMLATRNIKTAEVFGYPHLGGILAGHDKRCNVHNGNMAVIDLTIGEGRSYHVDRLVAIEWYGEITDATRADTVYSGFKEFSEAYNKAKPQEMSMEELTSLETLV